MNLYSRHSWKQYVLRKKKIEASRTDRYLIDSLLCRRAEFILHSNASQSERDGFL